MSSNEVKYKILSYIQTLNARTVISALAITISIDSYVDDTPVVTALVKVKERFWWLFRGMDVQAFTLLYVSVRLFFQITCDEDSLLAFCIFFQLSYVTTITLPKSLDFYKPMTVCWLVFISGKIKFLRNLYAKIFLIR